MNQIYEANDNFDFTHLSLGNPNGLQGGAHFTKLSYNNEPLYMQFSKCSTKQGIIKTGKKIYSDLLFTNDDTPIIEWLQNLEDHLCNLIYQKRNIWFHTEFELDDIRNFFNPIIRTYKGNKYLVRTYVTTPKHIQYKPNIQIFDEEEQVKTIEDVTSDSKIITIAEVLGVKFTSRSFQIELSLRQIMILDDRPLFSGCLIRTTRNTRPSDLVINEKILLNKPKEDLEQDSEISIPNLDDNVEEDQENKPEETTIDPVTAAEDKAEDDIETLQTESENIKARNEGGDTEEHQKATSKDTQDNEADDENINNIENINTADSTEVTKENLEKESLDKIMDISSNLVEVDLDYKNLDNDKSVNLKKPNDVYYEIYREARNKAKSARAVALEAYLDAKNIKATYMLEDIQDSDEEFNELFSN